MKRTIAAAAALALVLAALPASAGVVITQHQSVAGGMGQREGDQTVMLQGNKNKVVNGSRELITDLDSGKLYMISTPDKSYVQMDWPPKGAMAQMYARNWGLFDFKKAGTSRKIAGYACDDYNGSADTLGGTMTTTQCFSTSAPGAKEYNSFVKNVAAKLQTAGVAAPSLIPPGVPLATQSTIKIGGGNFTPPAGMSPDQAAKIQQMLANRPPIQTKTEVTKVESKNLPADTFTVPAGFTQRQPRMPGMGMPPGHPPMGGSGTTGGSAPGAAASPAAPANP